LGYTATGLGVTLAGIAIDIAIGTGLSFLASLFQEKPALPNQPEEFTYGAGGVRTGTGLGMPIPIVYGEHVIGGHVIGATTGHIGGQTLKYENFTAIKGGKRTRLTIALGEGPFQEIAGYTADADFQWFNKLGKDATLYRYTPSFSDSRFQTIGINSQAGQERIAFMFWTGEEARILSEIQIALKLEGAPPTTSEISIRVESNTGTKGNVQPSGVQFGETMSKNVYVANPGGHSYHKFIPSFPIDLPPREFFWVVIEVDYPTSLSNYLSLGYWKDDVVHKGGSSNMKKGTDSSPYTWSFLTPFVPGNPPTGANEHSISVVQSQAESFIGFGKVKINGNEIEAYAANGYAGVRMGTLGQDPLPGESDLTFEQPTEVALPVDKWQLVGETGAVNGFGLVVSFPQGWYRGSERGPAPAEFRMGVAWRPKGASWDYDAQFFMDSELYFGKPNAIEIRIDLSKRKGQPVQPGTELEVRAIQFWTKDNVEFQVIAESIKEFSDVDAQTHPHLALLYLDTDVPSATGQLEKITTHVKGKVMHYYDNGVWRYGYTDNQSHCCLDLILNERYGGGATMTLDNVDLESFQDWADWCDTLIFDGERWRKQAQLGLVIDEERSWWDWCKQIASTARCKLVPFGNKIIAKVDVPREVTQILTSGNIVEDSLVIRYLPRNKRANKVIVEFLNAENDYALETVEEEDPSVREDERDVITETVSMIGITNAHIARRRAKYLLNLNQGITFGGEVKAFIDMLNAQPGDVILLHAGLYRPERLNYVDPLAAPFDGTFTLTLKGTPDKPITFKAAGDGEEKSEG